jgi:hypothetical protein
VIKMTRIEELITKIETERLKLNIALDKDCSDLQSCYAQNILLDGLIEDYINELDRLEC